MVILRAGGGGDDGPQASRHLTAHNWTVFGAQPLLNFQFSANDSFELRLIMPEQCFRVKWLEKVRVVFQCFLSLFLSCFLSFFLSLFFLFSLLLQRSDVKLSAQFTSIICINSATKVGFRIVRDLDRFGWTFWLVGCVWWRAIHSLIDALHLEKRTNKSSITLIVQLIELFRSSRNVAGPDLYSC